MMSRSAVTDGRLDRSFVAERGAYLTDERERYCATPTESLSASPASAVSEDSVVPRSQYAGLDCVACNCVLCGKEFRKCVSPRGDFPDFSLFQHHGMGWHLAGRSIPLLVLPFYSREAIESFLQDLRSTVVVRTHAWWSTQCFAGRPRSSCLQGTNPHQQGYHLFSQTKGEWCMFLMLEAPGGLDGFWTDQVVMLEVRRLLGCLSDVDFVKRMRPVGNGASGELVPHDHLRHWMDGREEVLQKCEYEMVEPPDGWLMF